MAGLYGQKRMGVDRLHKWVTEGTSDLREQLARLQEASKNGAHSDDVAGVAAAVWAAHGYSAMRPSAPEDQEPVVAGGRHASR